MKKFDISNIIVSKIYDVHSYTLPKDTEGESVTDHCTLLVKKNGSSEYVIDQKKYTADPNTALFLPAGTPYSMYVCKPGECVIIEFDLADNGVEQQVCDFPIQNDKDIMETVKAILTYWKLKGPSYHSKCLSELYNLFCIGLLVEIVFAKMLKQQRHFVFWLVVRYVFEFVHGSTSTKIFTLSFP